MSGGRKVLFVAYHFPPDASVGAIRPAKFVKYLRKAGWEPVIVTVGLQNLRAVDPGRLADVSDVEIIRVPVWPTAVQLALRVRDAVAERLRGKKGASTDSHGSERLEEVPRGRKGIWHALARHVGALLELPDRQVGWLLPAVYASYRAIRRHGISHVVTSSPPRTTALVGLALSWIARVRLVTDLRDPWFLGSHKDAESRSRLSDGIERWLEGRVIQRSSAIVTTNDRYRRFLTDAYPHVDGRRFSTLWNGYDPEDFDGEVPRERANRFTLAYLGTFYFGRTPRAFLEGFRRFVDRYRLGPGEVVARLVGSVRVAEGTAVADMIRASGLEEYVELLPPIPYRDAIRLMRQADVLLLFAPSPTHDFAIPGKTFEYVASGARILCFGDGGATAELMRWTGAGEVLADGDAEAVAEALSRLYRSYRAGVPTPLRVDRSTFDRRALTERLAAILRGEEAADSHGTKDPVGGRV